MKQRFRERIEQLAKARYSTSYPLDALKQLRVEMGIPAKRLADVLAGSPAEDWELQRMATALRVDIEDLFADPNVLKTKDGFKKYLKRNKEGHRFSELWPKLRDGVAYRTAGGELEKPLDERHFRAFMAEQGLTDYGEWQLELGL